MFDACDPGGGQPAPNHMSLKQRQRRVFRIQERLKLGCFQLIEGCVRGREHREGPAPGQQGREGFHRVQDQSQNLQIGRPGHQLHHIVFQGRAGRRRRGGLPLGEGNRCGEGEAHVWQVRAGRERQALSGLQETTVGQVVVPAQGQVEILVSVDALGDAAQGVAWLDHVDLAREGTLLRRPRQHLGLAAGIGQEAVLDGQPVVDRARVPVLGHQHSVAVDGFGDHRSPHGLVALLDFMAGGGVRRADRVEETGAHVPQLVLVEDVEIETLIQPQLLGRIVDHLHSKGLAHVQGDQFVHVHVVAAFQQAAQGHALHPPGRLWCRW